LWLAIAYENYHTLTSGILKGEWYGEGYLAMASKYRDGASKAATGASSEADHDKSVISEIGGLRN
jgi:hypothetical protein